jgi:hypothetical protein
MMRKCMYFFILSAVLSCSDGFAQFDMEGFLSTSKNDISLNPSQSKLDFLKENNFNGPWISRVEFRTRSNDANISQDDFRLRFTPANPGELKANKRYYDKQVDLLNLEYQEEFNNALRQRYLLMVNHIFEFEKIAHLKKQLDINRHLIELMNQGSGAYSMDLGDLIDAESNEMDMNLSIDNSKIELKEIEYLIKEVYEFNGEINWDEEELIEVQDILNLFEEFKAHPTGQHIYLTKIDQKNILASERFNIEKSETLRNIGYFQAEYDVDRGNEASEHFGYQIGIRIPIVNPDKPDLNRRKLALMDDEAVLEERKEEYQREMELSVVRMEHYAHQLKEIEDKLAVLSKQNFLGLQSPGKSVKISDLIKLNEFHEELISNKNSVQKKIYETYLKYLDLNGKLSELPLRNYLSKDLTEF